MCESPATYNTHSSGR